MAASTSFIIFRRSEFDLPQLQEDLQDCGFSVLVHTNKVAIWLGGGPLILLTFCQGLPDSPALFRAARRLLLETELHGCDAHVRLDFDDLDAVRAKADTLIGVQEVLQDATGGFVFNAWNS